MKIKSVNCNVCTPKEFGHYNIKFKEVLANNWPEFGKKTYGIKANDPIKRMLIELEIVR